MMFESPSWRDQGIIIVSSRELASIFSSFYPSEMGYPPGYPPKNETHPIFSFRLGNDFLRGHESLRPTDCLWMLLHSFWAIDIVDPFPNTIPVRNQRCWTTGKSLVCRWSTFLSWCIYNHIYISIYIYRIIYTYTVYVHIKSYKQYMISLWLIVTNSNDLNPIDNCL